MANEVLSPVAVWCDAQSVSNGDDDDAAYDKLCHQAHADRAEFLKTKRDAAVSSSLADSVASLESAFTGDTAAHVSTVCKKTVTATAGDVIVIILTCGVLMNSSAGNATTAKLKCTDNGVSTYLDGAVQVIGADGLAHRVVFVAKHTMVSTTAVLALEVTNSNNAVSTTLTGGWCIATL